MAAPCGQLLLLLLLPTAVCMGPCEADPVCAAAAAASAEAHAEVAPEALHMLQRRARQQHAQASDTAEAAAGATAQHGLYLNCTNAHTMLSDLVKISAINAGEHRYMANMQIQDPMLLSPADYVEPPTRASDSVKLRLFRFIDYPPSEEYPNNQITGVNTGDFGWVCTMAAEAAVVSDAPETLERVEFGAYLYIYRAEVLKTAFSHGIYAQCRRGICGNDANRPSRPHPGWARDSEHLGDVEGTMPSQKTRYPLNFSTCPYYPCMELPPTLSVRYAEAGPAVLQDLRLERGLVAGSVFRVHPVPGGTAHAAGVRRHARLVEVIPWPPEAQGKEGEELLGALVTAMATRRAGALTLRFVAPEHDPYISREWGTTCYGCFAGTSAIETHSSYPGCFQRDPGVLADRLLFPGTYWKGRWYSSPRAAEGAVLDAPAAEAFFAGKLPALEGNCSAWPGQSSGQWGGQCLEKIIPTRCLFLHVLNSTTVVSQLAEADFYEAFRRAVLATAFESPLPGCEPLDAPGFVTCP